MYMQFALETHNLTKFHICVNTRMHIDFIHVRSTQKSGSGEEDKGDDDTSSQIEAHAAMETDFHGAVGALEPAGVPHVNTWYRYAYETIIAVSKSVLAWPAAVVVCIVLTLFLSTCVASIKLTWPVQCLKYKMHAGIVGRNHIACASENKYVTQAEVN
jgi:hypothetical protein